MRRALLIAAVLLSGCGEWHSTAPHDNGELGTSTGSSGDGGISFTVRDGGGSSGSTGTTSTAGSSGSSGSGATGGTTGLSGTTGAASSGSTGSSGTSGVYDAGAPDAGFIDNDLDGLDDRAEAQVLRDYLPYLSQESSDGCPLSGLVYRVSPHPQDATYLHVVVDELFERDCGAFGAAQVGDDETFAMTIDPRLPAPQGIVYVKAISHQGGSCARTTQCTTHAASGACQGVPSCDLGTVRGTQRPVLYISNSKHGIYLSTSDCTQACLDQCSLSSLPSLPPNQNAGEPGSPLTRDLTDAGFINYPNGWTQQALMHYDPWGTANFGAGGSVSSDLTDPAFDTPICP